MSKFIATRAIRGAHAAVKMADDMLQDALNKMGPDTPIVFKDTAGGGTAFHLPTIWGLLGIKVQKLGELKPVVEYAKGLLPPVPSENMWLPYLGETLDAGAAGVAILLRRSAMSASKSAMRLSQWPWRVFPP